jgi:hypothetical protein
MDPRTAKTPLLATDGVSWLAVFAGPVAWFVEQQASYALVPWSCGRGATLALHLVTLAALALVAAGGVLAWRDWSASRTAEEDAAEPRGRAHFVALLGLMMCALFALVVLVHGAASFWFDPCQR